MKKRYLGLMVILVISSLGSLSAQTFAEYFKQKKTQKKYLLAQIAALQSYIRLAEKGYRITSDGLNLIGDIKNGTFTLDKDYFSSLDKPNAVVKALPEPSTCAALAAAIRKLHTKSLNQLGSDWLSPADKSYIQHVWTDLLGNLDADIVQLDNLMGNDSLVLKDAVRIQLIKNLYAAILDKYGFASQFYTEVDDYILNQTHRAQELEQVTDFYKP